VPRQRLLTGLLQHMLLESSSSSRKGLTARFPAPFGMVQTRP
jgi:hypothetical protein